MEEPRTAISDDEVAKACMRLELEYIDLTRTMGPPSSWCILGVSSSALEATGAWPNAVGLADQILQGLHDEAQSETDTAKAGRLRAAAQALGETVREVGVSVLASVITRHTGLA